MKVVWIKGDDVICGGDCGQFQERLQMVEGRRNLKKLSDIIELRGHVRLRWL
jgi:hypothetical protein